MSKTKVDLQNDLKESLLKRDGLLEELKDSRDENVVLQSDLADLRAELVAAFEETERLYKELEESADEAEVADVPPSVIRALQDLRKAQKVEDKGNSSSIALLQGKIDILVELFGV